MTNHKQHADQQWVQAVLADLQHQIDDLTTELAALTHLVHAHTMAALDPRRERSDHHG
jgi:hypothetical protein